MDTQILKQVEEEFPGWEIPLYASYDDRISSRQLADIIEAEDPEETFKRTIMQQWEDAVDYCNEILMTDPRMDVLDEVRKVRDFIELMVKNLEMLQPQLEQITTF